MRRINKFLIILIIFIFSGSLSLNSALAKKETISLNLDEAVKIAIQNNLDIKLAKISSEFKRADLILTNSIFDTILSLDANYEDDQLKKSSSLSGAKSLTANYNFGVSKKFKTGTTVALDFANKREHTDSTFASVNPAHTSTMKITAAQPLGENFFGLIDRSDVKIARLNIEQADLETLDRVEDVLAGVQINYWKVAYAYKVINLKEDMLKKAQNLYNVYKERYQRGMAEKSDIYASEANVKQREIDINEAKEKLNSAINTLTLSLNIGFDKNIETEDFLRARLKEANFTQNLKQAIDSRRDYQSALKQLQSQNIEVVRNKNKLWPQINLVASYAKNGLDVDREDAINDIFNKNDREYYVGINISLPFENRESKAQYNKALLGKEQDLLNLKKLEISIVRELDDKVREVNLNCEKVRKWGKIVDLQQKKLKEEKKRISYGRSNSDTLIRFQEDLLGAELALAKSYLDYRISRIKLEGAKNEILSSTSISSVSDINYK